MDIGLLHSHTGAAYIIFLAAIINLVLALAPSKNVGGMAKIMGLLHNVLLWGGRVNLLIGIVMWMRRFSEVPILELWWAWSALFFWAPVEILAKRMVKPDLQYMQDGGQASQKLVIGTGLQLLVVAIIFGIMHAK